MRQSMPGLQLLKYPHQPLRVDRCINFDMQYLSIEIINHVEGTEAPPAGQRIRHEVHRPDCVRQAWDIQWYSGPLRQSTLRSPSYIQMHRFVYSIESLVIPAMAKPPQALVALPEAPAWVPLHQCGQRRNQLSILHCPIQWRRVPSCSR